VKAFINMSQMTLAQMSISETTPSPQHKLHWLAEQALNWSGLPVVQVRPTVLLEGFFLIFHCGFGQRIKSDQTTVRRGQGFAGGSGRRCVCDRRAACQSAAAHRQDLSPDRSSVREHAFAQEYSKALGRTITFQDIPVEPWQDGLLERGLPVHLVNHRATMADLHRAGRYDRMSDDVITLTGQRPLSVQEFVRKHSATFTAPAASSQDPFAEKFQRGGSDQCKDVDFGCYAKRFSIKACARDRRPYLH
jgi:hypothetical protein